MPQSKPPAATLTSVWPACSRRPVCLTDWSKVENVGALTQTESARDFSPVFGERGEAPELDGRYLQFRDSSCSANNASFLAKNANSSNQTLPMGLLTQNGQISKPKTSSPSEI